MGLIGAMEDAANAVALGPFHGHFVADLLDEAYVFPVGWVESDGVDFDGM